MHPSQPRRLHRTRRRFNVTPAGAVYVGRPSIWANPFERPGIGHARSVILYRSWLAGEVGPIVLRTLRYGEDQIEAMSRWRRSLLASLRDLAGRDLQCWCPLSSDWCHADVLIRLANGPRRLAA